MKLNNLSQEIPIAASSIVFANVDKKDEAKKIVIEEAGFPFKLNFMENPKIEIKDKTLFEHYAREQWYGSPAIEGSYLFDQKILPDYGFKIISAIPNDSIIGDNTEIILLNEEKRENENIKKIESNLTINDVIGQEKAKNKCKIIKKYLENPEQFGEWGPNNILFYGNPGTGKTMLVKALSNDLDIPFHLIKATNLIGDHVGDGARQIHDLFENARESTHAIIFIDEIDAIALHRQYQSLRGDVSEIVNALLSEMDGISENEGIITIAATNNPEQLDFAVRSRFEDEFEFTLPTEAERTEIFKKYISTLPLKVELTPKKLSKMTDKFSGRDIKEKVLKSSLHIAIADGKEKITSKEINASINNHLKKSETPKNMFV
ncbi:MAG: AAA family ATPase [Methanobrevibacter sp.]|jgi:AAA family ATPase|nr:AAA family ATPase [Candidatus Methanoflexus mossambicus]